MRIMTTYTCNRCGKPLNLEGDDASVNGYISRLCSSCHRVVGGNKFFWLK